MLEELCWKRKTLRHGKYNSKSLPKCNAVHVTSYCHLKVISYTTIYVSETKEPQPQLILCEELVLKKGH